ncbi:hypothetical protein D3C72_1501300 [compost metagenome]
MQTDVLPGREVHHRPAIDRGKVERGDFVTLQHLGDNPEGAVATPPAYCMGLFFIARGFGPDQDRGQLPIRFSPGAEHCRRCNRRAKHLTNRSYRSRVRFSIQAANALGRFDRSSRGLERSPSLVRSFRSMVAIGSPRGRWCCCSMARMSIGRQDHFT